MKISYLPFCCFFLIFFIAHSHAKNDEKSLQAYLQGYKNLSGEFTQIISSEKSSHTRSLSGEFWVKKPGQFRWHYSTPYVQKIVSNGDKLWVYDEDLEQVTIKNVSQSVGSSPLAIILGSMALDKLFVITQLDDMDNLQWLRLTPKTESTGFEFINVGFKNRLLSKMLLQDDFGQTTRLLFTNVSISTPIDRDTFNFIVPEGADVFDETIEQ